MLVFPELVLHGAIPNRDFLHLYGPGSLWALAGAFKVFGVSLLTERLFGLGQQLAIVFGIYALDAPVGPDHRGGRRGDVGADHRPVRVDRAGMGRRGRPRSARPRGRPPCPRARCRRRGRTQRAPVGAHRRRVARRRSPVPPRPDARRRPLELRARARHAPGAREATAPRARDRYRSVRDPPRDRGARQRVARHGARSRVPLPRRAQPADPAPVVARRRLPADAPASCNSCTGPFPGSGRRSSSSCGSSYCSV